MPSDTRALAAGNFLLRLGGKDAGFLKAVEGGGVTAEVIQEGGPQYFVKKHLGSVRYEDFLIQIDLSNEKEVYDWIADSWGGNFLRRNGSIIACNHKFETMSEREFFKALIVETTIPAMDAASKEPGYMTVRIAPETTQFKKSSGKVVADSGKGAKKLWLPSNFRLEIDGLDCTRIIKIDSFTVRHAPVTGAAGAARDRVKESGKLDFPNLKISLAEVAAQSWIDWHEDFVIKGNNDESREKKGSLVFLSSNLQSELGRINFFNLGIFRITWDRAESHADQIKRVSAELYCERMEFQH